MYMYVCIVVTYQHTNSDTSVCTSCPHNIHCLQAQPGKYTTTQLWNEYFLPPWDVWSLASHDATTPGRESTNIAGTVPSNQCQESWHRVIKRVVGKGRLRAGTTAVIEQRLPTILRNDAITMPDQLCFQITHYEPSMLRKAIKYLELRNTDTHVRPAEKPSSSSRKKKAAPTSWFVLRLNGKFGKFTAKLVKQYASALNGDVPSSTSEDDLDTPLRILKHASDICAAAHWVSKGTPDMCYPCTLNPAHLVCTCKRSRSITLCSHIIVVTALTVPGTYNLTGLKHLVQKLCEKGKNAPHRPRAALGGTRIQPAGDSAAESSSEDEPENSDGFSSDEDDPGELEADLESEASAEDEEGEDEEEGEEEEGGEGEEEREEEGEEDSSNDGEYIADVLADLLR